MFTATVGIPLLSCYSQIRRVHSVCSQHFLYSVCISFSVSSLLLSSLPEVSHVFHRVLELLSDVVLLLGDSVCELVWDDRSLVGTELASQNTTHDKASYVDEWIHFTEGVGVWGFVGHQTICQRHTGIRCFTVKWRHVMELNELYKATKGFTSIHTSHLNQCWVC